MDVSKDVDLLTEYTQWVSTRKLVASDTSPEEFMRDRLKEVAFDRVQEALDYLQHKAVMRTEPNKHDIKAILEGTYDGTNTVREKNTGPAAQELDPTENYAYSNDEPKEATEDQDRYYSP